jgi:hypothetical protein
MNDYSPAGDVNPARSYVVSGSSMGYINPAWRYIRTTIGVCPARRMRNGNPAGMIIRPAYGRVISSDHHLSFGERHAENQEKKNKAANLLRRFHSFS